MIDSHRYCVAFSGLIRQQWDELAAFTTAHRFDRGHVIYSMGDPSDAMYLIESGQVKVEQLSAGGKEKITGIYRKGELFGELCICKKGTRDSQAIALEPVTIVSFGVNGLLNLLRKTPEIIFDLLMVFCIRLFECQEQIATLAFDEVRERLAKELLRLSGLPGSQREKGGVRLAVDLTHQELANLVNTTRENVTRIMNEFREEGLLDYSREGIVIFPHRMEPYLGKLQA